ncbi:MAG: SprT-like domain-containing protein [Nitrospira sp.]|nr:SprT-like domain-containing protein [Nitrospira sp.]MDH4251486.1 SprT-like domain-containing protein [Nitrospira sp.]MDH4342140.1 SprT-like domain-containing protein [Nitrospira sp.]MDH5335421.1 SprT-like domain-containing protein [Nitrospira sp.]
MSPSSSAPSLSVLLSSEWLQAHWQHLNTQYFSGSLRPIEIVWSQRLTSSVGMFACREGPKTFSPLTLTHSRREIRLSLPLFEQLTARTPYAEQELLNTLAHEMIHQWQFDVLKRRPDHGLEFLRKMAQMNRTGTVAVTTYHTLEKEVMALAKFAWRCQGCGRLYRRHRRTIQPKRHHCGSCRGALQELVSPTQLIEDRPTPYLTRALDSSIRSTRPAGLGKTPEQLTLELT